MTDYDVYREIFALFYILPISPRLSVGEFKTWVNSNSQIIMKTVWKCRGAKITQGEINPS